MELFGQMTLNGLMLGMTLMLVALGLTLIFGVMDIMNLAHGEFYMLSAFILWYFLAELGFPFWAAALIATAIVALLGVLVERGILRRFRGNLIMALVAGIGIVSIMQSSAILIFGTLPKSIPEPFSGVTILGGIFMSNQRLMAMLISLGLVLAAIAFIRFSRQGRAMRAVAQNPTAAQLMGVSLNATASMTMVIGCALLGAAAALIGPIYGGFTADIGFPLMVKSFIVIVLGGLGSVAGAVIAALFLGLVESYATTLIGPEIAGMILFLTLAVTLIVRPRGLFGVERKH